MTDHEIGICYAETLSKLATVAIGEPINLNAGRHDCDWRRDTSTADQRRNAFTRREHMISEVRIARRQLDDEAFERWRVAGNIVRVLLIKRVMGEN